MPKKLTYEHVKSYIESFEGYKLLSEEYKNSYTYLHIQCPNNHNFWRKWDEFRKGKGCYICSYEDKNSQQYLKLKIYITN